jgi:hypothetical protein
MRRFLSGHLWLAALVIYLMAGGAYAYDWPQYNGSAGDRTSTETIGAINWSSSAPPTPIWNVPLNKGFSSFSVVGGKAFTLVSRYDASLLKEFCVALDASTGTELWAVPMGPASYESGPGTGDGPRSTPSCDGERVYAFDASLHLYCFNAANGNMLWDKDIVADYAGRPISWQNAISPLLEGEAVVVAGGGAGQSALAFDRVDGHLLWSTLDERITHATPVAATIQGVRQIIFLMQSGLVAVSVTDGTELWQYTVPYSTSTAASPVVWGNYVFCSAAYGVGADVCQITKNGDQWTATQVWRKSGELMNHWSTPVCYNGYVYSLVGHGDYDTAPLKCIELLTGDEKWSRAGFGQGGLMAVGDKLVVLEADGDIVVVQATPAAYTEIARAKMLNGKCWSTPILSDNRIYTRSTTQGVCFSLSELSLSCAIGATTTTITNTGPVDYPVTFSEAVTGFDSADDIQVNATGTAAAGLVAVVGGSGAGPYTVRLSAITGDGTLGITVKAGACSDAGGTTNTMSAPSGTFTVDNTAPTAEISLAGSNPTNADTVSFAVNFSESVEASFDGSDVVASGTLASGALIGVTGGLQNYTVAATPADPNADGALGIQINSAGVNDPAGNVFGGGSSVFYAIDNTVPAVAISPPSVSRTHAGPVSYTLSFSLATFVSTSEDMLSSITLNKMGTANGTVGVTGSGNLIRTVTISGITGDGTLSITVERGTASNDMGVRAAGAGPSEAVTVRSAWPKAGVKYFQLDYK